MSRLPDYSDYLHVAAAAVVDPSGRVLIARRPDHLHQGGLWEFPGGKVERGESVGAALARELREEVGIEVRAARPLIRVPHDYGDRRVLLDVWRVGAFDGEPHGREGQPVRWVPPEDLSAYRFPAANRPIITAVRLPERYLITPDPGSADQWPAFLARLDRALAGGVRLIQLRDKTLTDAAAARLAPQVAALCRRHRAELLLNSRAELARTLEGVGVHLSGQALAVMSTRPLPSSRWVAASCHSLTELARASALGADFAVVSPVRPTGSHPASRPIGFEGLHAFCEHSTLPIYGLGGLGSGDIELAQQAGAQGIAAISGLWNGG